MYEPDKQWTPADVTEVHEYFTEGAACTVAPAAYPPEEEPLELDFD